MYRREWNGSYQGQEGRENEMFAKMYQVAVM